MSYRDSYAQYQHLPYSHYVLYQEWLQDEPIPTPDQLPIRDPVTTTATTTTYLPNDPMLTSSNGITDSNQTQGNTVPVQSTQISSKYWDVFNDDEDWEIFNRAYLTVESNGNLIFNKPAPYTDVKRGKRGKQSFSNGPTFGDIEGSGDESGLVYMNSNVDGSMDFLRRSSGSSINSSNSSSSEPENGDRRTRGDAIDTVGVDDTNEDEDEDNVIVGSLFDPRTLTSIKQRINGWENSLPKYIVKEKT